MPRPLVTFAKPKTRHPVLSLDPHRRQILAKVSGVLEQYKIPYVVDIGINLVLLGTGEDDFENREVVKFVIQDDHVWRAMRAITTETGWIGYIDSDEDDCNFEAPDSASLFWILRKSDIYWALPDLPVQAPAADDRYYALSNDPRFGQWPDELGPVRIVTPVAILESLILLTCRDLEIYWDGDGHGWYCYLDLILAETGRPEWNELWPKPKKLQPVLQDCWRKLNYSPEEWFEALHDVYDELFPREDRLETPSQL